MRSGGGQTGPWTYTVGARDQASDNLAATGDFYDWSVYGPNGFLRTFVGSLRADSAKLAVRTSYDTESGGIALVLQNHGSSAEKVSIFDAYSGKTHSCVLQPHGSATFLSQLEESFLWYDFRVRVESDSSFERNWQDTSKQADPA